MNRNKKIIVIIGLICVLLLGLTGCDVDVPVYWQDRCEPLDFHTKFREFNLSWEEIEEKSSIFAFVPEFKTEENCFELDSVYHKAVEEPKQLAEEYVKILEQEGFTSDYGYANKFYKYGYCCTKVICEDFNGFPVKAVVTIRYNELEFKEQYNLCISYDFSDYRYGKYLEEQEAGRTEVIE